MAEDYHVIIEKARELAELIEAHEITRKYRASIEEMSKDKKAQDFLAQLVLIGKNLNEKAARGEDPAMDSPSEKDMLQKELDSNELIRNHILSQKQYLNLIQMVMDKIKSPEE
ncbi:MAG: YlbF family regulator [bacterium]|nr:YlbF family regulator [bacterium]